MFRKEMSLVISLLVEALSSVSSKKDSIALDEDLLGNSARSLETLVTVGMQLGVSIKKHTELPLPDINNCVLGA